jgi:hypothetical protein
MASALNIYANLLWRDAKNSSQIKKIAALQLLSEPHYRLHLEDLSKALLSRQGSSIPSDLLLPARLAEIISADGCFVYSDAGNILLDAATLMVAGKECLKAQIDRVWDTASSALSWARNQLVGLQETLTQWGALHWYALCFGRTNVVM